MASETEPSTESTDSVPQEAVVACVDERAGLLLGFPAPVKPDDDRAHERVDPLRNLD